MNKKYTIIVEYRDGDTERIWKSEKFDIADAEQALKEMDGEALEWADKAEDLSEDSLPF